MLKFVGRLVLFQAIVMGTLFGPSSKAIGAEDGTIVTPAVVAAVKDNKLVINATNETFGDTAPGIPKKLTVEYRVGDDVPNPRRSARSSRPPQVARGARGRR